MSVLKTCYLRTLNLCRAFNCTSIAIYMICVFFMSNIKLWDKSWIATVVKTWIYIYWWKYKWLRYKCSCGREKEATVYSWAKWSIKSCWCLKKTYCSTHWLSSHTSYKSWKAMMHRCYKEKHKHFKYYWWRWVKVCKRRHDVRNFIRDMWERPIGKTLDRIDNDKWYFKENCKRSSYKTQSRNRRNNNYISVSWTMYCIAWRAEHLWVNYNTLQSKIYRYWKKWISWKEVIKELLYSR